jgi:hypothetical protein
MSDRRKAEELSENNSNSAIAGRTMRRSATLPLNGFLRPATLRDFPSCVGYEMNLR